MKKNSSRLQIALRKREKCGDCGTLEGQLHTLGCDMERCPFCGHQLISCDCVYERLGLFDDTRYDASTAYLPPEIYSNGLTAEQEQAWRQMLDEKGRIPYVQYPVLCAKCGALWPDFFRVPDKEWKHYIRADMRRKVVCLSCYEEIKQAVDAGTARDGVQYPLVCAKCGALNPAVPSVSSVEWQSYIQPDLRNEVICQSCYAYIKIVIGGAI